MNARLQVTHTRGKVWGMQGKIKTVQQHILDEERMHPEATGDFTALLTTLTLAAKIISREVNMAGLAKILGETGEALDSRPPLCSGHWRLGERASAFVGRMRGDEHQRGEQRGGR